MKTQTLPMRSPTPFLPYSGSSAGLTEKRVGAYSSLALIGSALLNAAFTRDLESTLNLADSVGTHVNNASDPATDTLNLASVASRNMEFSRGVSSNLTFTDVAHASLDGYHPPGGGTATGDKLTVNVTAGEAISKGQPVYLYSSNTVKLANADTAPDPQFERGFVFGLANASVASGATLEVVTEGSVEQSDWSAVTGTTNLVGGSWYYLGSPTAGKLTTYPSTNNSYMAMRVGRAINETKFDIETSDGIIQ